MESLLENGCRLGGGEGVGRRWISKRVGHGETKSSKEDGMKTSIAGACNTAVRTEGSGRAINQAAWKMPDQRRDVSAKTAWNRYSHGSRRTEERGQRMKRTGERKETSPVFCFYLQSPCHRWNEANRVHRRI